MKREILCKKCGERLQLGKYPDEGWKKVFGILREDTPNRCVCDECNNALSGGDEVCAVSMYTFSNYIPWETQYLAKPTKLDTWNGCEHDDDPPPQAA